MIDMQHQNISHLLSEVKHLYGENVHILSDPYLLSILARLCHPTTYQPEINRFVDIIYRHLVGIVVAHEFPLSFISSETRMSSFHNDASYNGLAIEKKTKAVVVDLARAGMFPSQIVYDHLNNLLEPQNVRQDHIFMNRKCDNEGRVVGTDVSGSKIGGEVDNSILIFPDPMGATGSSIIEAIDLYYKRGNLMKCIAVHLIITPEYVKAVKKRFPDLIVYAVRLDRGLSAKEVLDTIPGTYWEDERGLNNHHYIVPGGGGFGEVMNNSFV